MDADFHFDVVAAGPSAASFLPMTFPSYWSKLLGRVPGCQVVALAAVADQPRGLALAELEPNSDAARLLSVFVSEAHRRRGIGTALVRHLEQTLREQNRSHIVATYTPGKPGTTAITAVLQRCGWAAPKPHLLQIRAGHDAIPGLRSSPAFRRRALPAGYDYGLWAELTPDEQQQVADWMVRGIIPGYLNPFDEADRVDPRLSLTLRHEGRLVGFLVVHRVSVSVVRFASLFVLPDIPVMGLGLYLTVEALHRYSESEEGSEIVCGTYADGPLADFWRRFWLPAVPQANVTQSVYSGKNLIEATDATWQCPVPRADALG